MQRSNYGVLGLVVFLGLYFAFAGMKEAAARVEVGIHIGPPAFVFNAPPSVVVIPGTYVYKVPGVAFDIFFYHGTWYRPYAGGWYWAPAYDGPWDYLPSSNVPVALMDLPPYYGEVPPGYAYIPYGELELNWGRWERERHWDHDRAWREGGHARTEGRGGERHEGFEGRRGHEGHGEHGGGRRG